MLISEKASVNKPYVGVLLLLSLLFIGVPPSYAKELPTLYRGIRPLGMGDAFTAVSDDENALFYNPAGLKLETTDKRIEVLNPLFEVSRGTLDLLSDLQNLNGSNTSDVTAFINKRIGEHEHLRAALFPHLFMPPFAIGILAQGTGDMDVRNPVFPEAEVSLHTDIGLIVGGAHRFDRGIAGGVTLKYIQRKGASKTFTAVDVAAKSFDSLKDLTTRSDFAFDLGGMIYLSEWTPFEFGDPTVGVVLQNITDLDFKENGILPMQVNVGAAIHPEIGITQSTIALDLIDITQKVGTDNNLWKRTHLGAELRFPSVMSVRLGLNQGYLSGGFTIDFWIVRFDFATFYEELGASFRQRADHRTLAQLSLGF